MDPSLFGYSVEDFKEEAGELLSRAEEILSAMGKEPENTEFVNALFRAIHSIKGSSAYAGLNEVNTFSHLYESFLGELRNNKHNPNKDIHKLLVRAKDYLEDLIFNPESTHAPLLDDASTGGSMDRLIKAIGLKGTLPSAHAPESEGKKPGRAGSDSAEASILPEKSVLEKKQLLPKTKDPAQMDQEDVIKLTLTHDLKAFAADLKKSAPHFERLSKTLQKIEETVNWAFGDNTANVVTETQKMKSLLTRGEGPGQVIELRNHFNAFAQAIKRAMLSMNTGEETRSSEPQKDLTAEETIPHATSTPAETGTKVDDAQSVRGATEEDIVKITISRAIETISSLAEEKNPDIAQIGKMIRRLSDINKWAFNEDETVSQILGSMEEILQNSAVDEINEKIGIKNAALSSVFHTLLSEEDVDNEEEKTAQLQTAPSPRTGYRIRRGKHLPAKVGGPSMRVKSADLQSLMNTVGEIEGIEQKTLEKLQSQALQLRMVPVGDLFNRFRKIVRDIAEELDKEIELSLSGESVRLDKVIADKLQEPLLHMVRNSASHGIEYPHERKDPKKGTGIIKLAASHEGGQIIIEVSDNGRGISLENVRKRGIETGLIKEDDNLSAREIMDLIFTPGFSTKEKADGISGRGVGMDVVKNMVASVQGNVMVESREGEGTTLRLVLPLTLAIVNALIVREGNCMVGISAASVDRILTMSEEEISKNTFMENNRLSIGLQEEGDVIPIISLARVFGGREREGKKCIILLNSGLGQRIALIVDSALDRRSLTVKPLDKFAENRYFSSAAIYNKELVLILNIPGLMEA